MVLMAGEKILEGLRQILRGECKGTVVRVKKRGKATAVKLDDEPWRIMPVKRQPHD